MRSQTTDFEGLLEAVPDALVGVGRSGVICLANHQAESMFGYRRDALVGLPLETLVPQSRRREHETQRSRYNASPRTRSMGTDLNLVGLRRDGTEFPVDICLTPTGTGDDLVVMAAVRDMTEREKASEERDRMSRRLEALESSREAIIGTTPEGTIRSWNPASEWLFGYSREEAVGESVQIVTPGDRTQEADDILARIRAGEHVEHLETVRLHKDRGAFPVHLTASPVRDRDGAIAGTVVMMHDATKQIRALEAAQLMASVVEHSGEAIITSTLDGVITSWNPAAERLFGYSSEEIVGRSGKHLSPVDRTAQVREILARIGAGEVVGSPETQRVRKDGSVFPALLTISPILDRDDQIVGACAITRDMTDQRQALEAAQRLAAIVEQFPDAIVTKSLDGDILSWNPAAARMFGYTEEEILGRPGRLLGPPEQAGEIDDIVAAVTSGEPALRLETVRLRKDGSRFPVALTASPIRDSTGAISGASAIIRDITYQKRTFESARSMIEASLDSFVAISPDGSITDANEATVRITGVPRSELIGSRFSDLFTDPAMADEVSRRVFAEGTVEDYPLTVRRRDGHETYRDVLYNASVFRDAAGKVLGAFAAARDVTEQKKAAQYARSLIEAALDPMVTISPEGTITDSNEATVRATGVPRDRLIGTSFSDYFTDPERANEAYHLVFEQGSVRDYPLTLRPANGQETLAEVLYNASLYRDTDGDVLGVFASARDVTNQVMAQKDLAEQQARELERLAELERFQRLTVGRELKMIELKKQIEYLTKHGPSDGGERGDEH